MSQSPFNQYAKALIITFRRNINHNKTNETDSNARHSNVLFWQPLNFKRKNKIRILPNVTKHVYQYGLDVCVFKYRPHAIGLKFYFEFSLLMHWLYRPKIMEVFVERMRLCHFIYELHCQWILRKWNVVIYIKKAERKCDILILIVYFPNAHIHFVNDLKWLVFYKLFKLESVYLFIIWIWQTSIGNVGQ